MRLIDADVLKDIMYINKGNFNTVEGIREWIDNAPTVEIPVARWDCYCEGQKVGYEKALSEKPFTRKELESWLYRIADNNFGNELGRSCEEIIKRLDGFERYVKAVRNEEIDK